MTYLIATFGPSEQRVPLAYLALCCLPLGNGPLSLCWKLGLASLGRVLWGMCPVQHSLCLGRRVCLPNS